MHASLRENATISWSRDAAPPRRRAKVVAPGTSSFTLFVNRDRYNVEEETYATTVSSIGQRGETKYRSSMVEMRSHAQAPPFLALLLCSPAMYRAHADQARKSGFLNAPQHGFQRRGQSEARSAACPCRQRSPRRKLQAIGTRGCRQQEQPNETKM